MGPVMGPQDASDARDRPSVDPGRIEAAPGVVVGVASALSRSGPADVAAISWMMPVKVNGDL